MTGNWRTKSTNNSISNSFSGYLLFVSFLLFSSSSLVFSLSGLLLSSSSCSLPAVNIGAWISCLEATTRGVLWKKVGLQNTSGRLLLHVVDEEAAVDSHQADKTVFEKENSKENPEQISRVVSLREAMLIKVVDIKTKSDWLLKFQLKKSSKKVENV